MNRENLLMFFASMFIAVGMWFSLAPARTTTSKLEFYAPLEFQGLDPSLTVVGAPATVLVSASGAPEFLDQLKKETVTASIDLTGVRKTGTRQMIVNVSAPTRSKVVITPKFAKIPLDIQKVSSIDIKVDLEPSGQPQRDLVFDGATIVPLQVTIIGPENVLPKVKRARVSLDLAQVRPGLSQMIPVEVLDEANLRVPYVRVEPPEVSVSPAVAAATASKRVLVTPVWSGQPKFGYRVLSYEVKPSQIALNGESAALSRILTIETEPVVINNLQTDSTQTVKLRLPSGITSNLNQDVKVTVKIGPVPLSESKQN